MTDTVNKEIEMHQLIEGEESLKEKTITNSEAHRILKSDKGMEFEEVIQEMRRQGRVLPDPEITYESIVKDNWGNGKPVWTRSQIRMISTDEYFELEELRELGPSGAAGTEGRIYEDTDEPVTSYQFDGEGIHSIPFQNRVQVNPLQVQDTPQNQAKWEAQRKSYLKAQNKTDAYLNLLRKGKTKPEPLKHQSQVERVLQGERPLGPKEDLPIATFTIDGVQYTDDGKPVPEVAMPRKDDRIGTIKIDGIEI